MHTESSTPNFGKDQKYKIELNRVPIQWDLKEGTLQFFGIDSALFWNDPSLANFLAPIAEELGKDLFRLLVAHSSSLGTKEDYHAMITSFATNFEEGFLAWGQAVSAAGWGVFEIAEYNPNAKQAVIRVLNPWEIFVQKNLPLEKRWGAPFLQGKLIGIFSHAFNMPCWANDVCYYDSASPYAEIKIFQSHATISDELNKLRHERMLEKELDLEARIKLKTSELEQAKDTIQEYSRTLEKKVEERTADLVRVNSLLEQEIEIRKLAEAKLEENNRELLELSITDKLTGVANRRHFDNVLAVEWSRAQRTGSPLTLIIGDVDWFKKFNDTYGHQAGDQCLALAAQVLQKSAQRASDLIARYGGEEFAVVLPVTDTEQADSIADKMIRGFHDLNIPHSMSEYGYVTMSLGVAVLHVKENEKMELIVKTADDALYAAKNEGRNRYVIRHF